MDSELDRRNWWDEQSCREFEQFLDDWKAAQEANEKSAADLHDYLVEQESAEPPCTCYYTDVDVVENRYCEAHGKEF